MLVRAARRVGSRAATGEGFEPRLVKLHRGENKTPEYLSMNPNGQFPVLVVDGRPLNQIIAICDYLDRRAPTRAAGRCSVSANASSASRAGSRTPPRSGSAPR